MLFFCYSGHLEFFFGAAERRCYFVLLSAIFCYFGVVGHTMIGVFCEGGVFTLYQCLLCCLVEDVS